MNVAGVMTHPARTVTAGAPLRAAAAVMAQNGFSGLPVVDHDERVVGVVSEADVLAKERTLPRPGWLRNGAARRRHEALAVKGAATTVAEAMTAPALTVRPEASLAGAAALMLDHDVERLPVVGGDGRVLGIVTRADIVRAIARGA